MTKRFTHLHVHTEYSLLDGASKIPELVAYAKELGMDSLAITDHGAMYGAVEFYQECTKAGIKPIIGCEVYLSKGSHLEKNNRGMYHLILLAENDTGYHNLMKIVSIGQLEGFYYKPRVDKDVLRTYHEGVICLSACVAGEVPQMILQDNLEGARRCIQEYIDIFGKENYFLEIQDHDLDEEHKVSAELKQLAQEFGLGLVATNDLHYVQQKDAAAQDILLCIQTTSTVDEPDRMRFNNDSYYLKSYDEMEALFGDCPEALSNTNKIADRCNVKMEFGHLLLGLGDEYVGTTSYDDMYAKSIEPWEPNLTTLVGFGDKFWSRMVAEGTPVPTPDTEEYDGVVGVFEGGGYAAEGVYRPWRNCLMNNLHKTDELCPVCSKAIVDYIDFLCK